MKPLSIGERCLIGGVVAFAVLLVLCGCWRQGVVVIGAEALALLIGDWKE